jgi:acetyl esterase/lipase
LPTYFSGVNFATRYHRWHPRARRPEGSVETFRDEDIDYAARLSQAGVSVEFHMWPGGFHGFDGLAPQTALARAARAARLAYLRRALAA